MDQARLENRLRERLIADRGHPSRLRDGPGGTVIVTPSGTAVGLAYAIGRLTGEDDETVMNRVMNDEAGQAAMAEQEGQELWQQRARRLAEHALYHMDDSDVSAELMMAIVAMRIAEGEQDAAELPGPFPGDGDYGCLLVYRDCGYRP